MAQDYDTKDGCGISTVIMTGKDSFDDACKVHDDDYQKKIDGVSDETLKQVDNRFLNNMLKITRSSPWYKQIYLYPKAYIYFGIAHVWGLTKRKKLWAQKVLQKVAGIKNNIFDRLA